MREKRSQKCREWKRRPYAGKVPPSKKNRKKLKNKKPQKSVKLGNGKMRKKYLTCERMVK